MSWSSVEGQADYFATAKCLPKILKDDKENREVIKSAPPLQIMKARKKCGKKNHLCIRMAMASLSASRVFHSLREFEEFPELDKRDETVAYSTDFGHPAPQCRLDTFLNGINCGHKHNTMFDSKDPKVGSCEDPSANRPSCWYGI